MRCWLEVQLNPGKCNVTFRLCNPKHHLSGHLYRWNKIGQHKNKKVELSFVREGFTLTACTGDASYLNWVHIYLTKFVIIQCTLGGKSVLNAEFPTFNWLSSDVTAEMEIESMVANSALIRAREGKNIYLPVFPYMWKNKNIQSVY